VVEGGGGWRIGEFDAVQVVHTAIGVAAESDDAAVVGGVGVEVIDECLAQVAVSLVGRRETGCAGSGNSSQGGKNQLAILLLASTLDNQMA
jgi:hypothetical protein